jgi:hypothetical protein
MRKHRRDGSFCVRIAVAISLIALLLVSGCGSAGQGDSPSVLPASGQQGQSPQSLDNDPTGAAIGAEESDQATDAAIKAGDDAGATDAAIAKTDVADSKPTQTKADADKGTKVDSKKADTKASAASKGKKDKYNTEPVPAGKPKPVEPQDAAKDKKKTYSCTIYIECGKILENIDKLDPAKVGIVPDDGVILAKRTVKFTEGESVFDVLKRETRANKIHMEFVNTPVYNSAYIEGIANLYEFDCGELSGWVYSVNDWFPNYGSSRYQLKDGDAIEWHFTCDLGRDFGLNF